ncbi:MAG: hypothetical protein H0V66_14625 [Bdellovibrionales bacterium]|nr:hypothetical protein [Bdellovibrionales bacterium]
MKLFLLVIYLITSSALAQEATPSYIPSTRLLRAKGYQIGLYTDSFTTSKYIDRDGEKNELEEGETFNRLQSEFAGYYGATSDLQFGLGFRFRKNQATSEISGGDTLTASSQGLQSTFANIMFAFDQVDQMQYTLEGTFRYTPYNNEEFDVATDDPEVLTLGDDGNELSAGLGITYFGKNNNFLTVRAGYRRPGTDLSDEIYWQAEAALAWRYVALIAGVDGVSSMKSDPYEDAPQDRPIYNRGTELYNSQNREWITPYAGLNVALGNTWRIELRGSQVVSGNSTDLGSGFGINIIRRMDKSATRLVDSKFKTYDLESSITKVSPKKEYVVIDKGLADDFNKGMKIDFFEFDYIGGNILIASGVIVQAKSDTSIVKITQHYNIKKEIKTGLIGRTTLK